jgi:hypothetical protein
MSRNVMPEPTADDTRVDLRRPFFDAPSTPIPAAVLPDLEPDDDDDAATIQLSRLAWPEPPIKLSERPRWRTTAGIATTAAPMGVPDQRPTYWRGLAVAVILAASFSVFVPRPHSTPRAAADATPQQRPVATAPAPQPAPAMPPPLIITVGTPPSAQTASSPVTKAPVPVTKLPLARASAPPARPRAPSRPAVHAKPAAPAAPARSTPAPKAPAPSAETVVDDGF